MWKKKIKHLPDMHCNWMGESYDGLSTLLQNGAKYDYLYHKRSGAASTANVLFLHPWSIVHSVNTSCGNMSHPLRVPSSCHPNTTYRASPPRAAPTSQADPILLQQEGPISHAIRCNAWLWFSLLFVFMSLLTGDMLKRGFRANCRICVLKYVCISSRMFSLCSLP